MTDNLPPLPPCAPEFKPRWPNDPGGYTADQMQAYALAAIAAQHVPASQDAANLLARYERQWHRMGELWERCQGKGWPDKEGAEFAQLRDERAPATRAALLAFLAAAPQPQPVQQDHYKELAALGWQAIECPVCGSSAQAYPRQAAQPLADVLDNDIGQSGELWRAAKEMRSLEAANAELLESLVDLVALYPLDSTDAIITSARAAITKHGGAT